MSYRVFIIIVTAFSFSTAFAINVDENTVLGESEVSTKSESVIPPSKSSLKLNAQIGLSSFDYSGDATGSKSGEGFSGALTFDIGDKSRVVETGLVFLQAGAEGKDNNGNTTSLDADYIAIPMMAKFYTSGIQQGLYLKGGLLTAFLTNDNEQQLRKLDLIGQFAVGTTLSMGKSSRFIIEGSFNRGFLDALESKGNTYNQGFLLMGGMSFNL